MYDGQLLGVEQWRHMGERNQHTLILVPPIQRDPVGFSYVASGFNTDARSRASV
jgi:hypothetical protein